MKNITKNMTIAEKAQAMRDNADTLETMSEIIEMLENNKTWYMDTNDETGETVPPTAAGNHYQYVRFKAYVMAIEAINDLIREDF